MSKAAGVTSVAAGTPHVDVIHRAANPARAQS